MARYFPQDLRDTDGAPGSPPVAPLTGLQVASQARVKAVFRAQDKVVTTSRRILATKEFRAEQEWWIPNTDPEGTEAQEYPGKTDVVTVGRGKAELTPGCMLWVSLLYQPSGPTQFLDQDGRYYLDEPHGAVLVNVTWYDRDGGSESTTHRIDLPPSGLPNNAEAAGNGAGFKALREATVGPLLPEPPEALATPEDVHRWSRHSHVEIEIQQEGSPRVLDCAVLEKPWAIAMEADDDPDLWVSHLWGQPDPDGAGPSLQFPWQRLSETTPDGDPRGGTWHAADVANAQRLRLGPVLFSWSAWRESDGFVDGDEGYEFSNTGGFVSTEGDAYDTELPGFATGTGGYARRWKQNNHFVMHGNAGTIPVRACAYVTTDGNNTEDATIRVQTRDYSWVDVTVPASTAIDGWLYGYGHLEVGIGPGQQRTAHVLVNVGAGDAIVVKAAGLQCAGQYRPADLT